eukprot:CAMPEP_0172697942 /NCGR_PEP_ID=MMETSP1074-20121228/29100_1 /TAXON_ID=2916 /ORGANISM="Ceratium fusus, Strain PA161109" /LENGTH=53 /DNA_ID=CAMNT_0013518901 /DNA_START=65 /DNA_END=224 /DNA_ORIENTATION=-
MGGRGVELMGNVGAAAAAASQQQQQDRVCWLRETDGTPAAPAVQDRELARLDE